MDLDANRLLSITTWRRDRWTDQHAERKQKQLRAVVCSDTIEENIKNMSKWKQTALVPTFYWKFFNYISNLARSFPYLIYSRCIPIKNKCYCVLCGNQKDCVDDIKKLIMHIPGQQCSCEEGEREFCLIIHETCIHSNYSQENNKTLTQLVF